MARLRRISGLLMACAVVNCATPGVEISEDESGRSGAPLINGRPYSSDKIGILTSLAAHDYGVGTVIDKPRCVITARHVVKGSGPIDSFTLDISSGGGGALPIFARAMRADWPYNDGFSSAAACQDIAILYMRPMHVIPGQVPRFSQVDGMDWGAQAPEESFDLVGYTPHPAPTDRVAGGFDVKFDLDPLFCLEDQGNYIAFGPDGGQPEAAAEVGDSGGPVIDDGTVKGVLHGFHPVFDRYWATVFTDGNDEFLSDAIRNQCCARIDEIAYAEGECCSGLDIDGVIPDDIPNTPCRLIPPPVDCGADPANPFKKHSTRHAKGTAQSGTAAGSKQQTYDEAKAIAEQALDDWIAEQTESCESNGKGGQFRVGEKVFFPPDADSYGACEYSYVTFQWTCEVHAAVSGICCDCVTPEPGAEKCGCCFQRSFHGNGHEFEATCLKDGEEIESHSTIVRSAEANQPYSWLWRGSANGYLIGEPELWCTPEGWFGAIAHDYRDGYWQWQDRGCGVAGILETIPDSCSGTLESHNFEDNPSANQPVYDIRIQFRSAPDEPDPADFDEDGQVNGSDLLQWQRSTGPGSGNGADADGDGDTDADDLNAWQSKFGN